MSRASQDSTADFERLRERTRHTDRESSPEAQVNGNGHADTDVKGVGAAFWDRRESLDRPNSIDISEGEELNRHPSQIRWRNEVFSAVDAVSATNGTSSVPPISPTSHTFGSYIQPTDIIQFQEFRGRTIRRRRRRDRGEYKSTFVIQYTRSDGSAVPRLGHDGTNTLDGHAEASVCRQPVTLISSYNFA